MRSSARLAMVAIISALLVSSCASLKIDAIPLPGNSYSDGYNIVIEYDNALNLPSRAKVVMDGIKVGVVTNVQLTSRHVNVTARIDRGVAVPSNIHSGIQQATVLGDTYIALDRVPGLEPAAPLGPGGRIPITQTTPPPQLEDTIANLANFVGSGSIQRAQNTLIKVNRITPPRPEVREIASQVAADLSDLAYNIDNVDLWLDGLARTADVMYANTANFNEWFSPAGITKFHHNFIASHFIAPLLPALGTVYYQGYWLVPTLEAVAGALEAIQHSKWAFDEEAPRWRNLITDYIVPVRKYPAINITSIVGPDDRELSGNVAEVLRMIGAMP